MRNIFAFGILLLFAFSACKNDSSSAKSNADVTNATTLAGFWVPIDFCSRAGKDGSVLRAMNGSSKPYAYALGFDSAIPDSVTCYNGFEKWRMPVMYRKDTLEIPKANGDLSIFLVYDPETNKDLTMFNSTHGRTEINRFTLSKAQVMDGYSAFLLALNNSMMGGNFQSTGKDGAQVRFTPDGLVKGLKGFDRYELCTGGDCVLMQDLDVMTMQDSQKPGSEQMFGYQFSAKKDSLQIFNLINNNPAEKGNYSKGSVAYSFIKKAAAAPVKKSK